MSINAQPIWENDPDLLQEVLSPVLYRLLVVFRGQVNQVNQADLIASLSRLQHELHHADEDDRHLLLSQLAETETGLLQHLVTSIETDNGCGPLGAICGLLHEAFTPSKSGEARECLTQSLIELNATEALLRAMKSLLHVEGVGKVDCSLLQMMQVLAKLASKDPKFPVKARLLGTVKLFHQLLQSSSKASSAANTLPILILLKCITKNATNQIVLGKDGLTSTLMSSLKTLPKSGHWAKQKVAVECLSLLTKPKSNVVRIVRENGMQRLFSLLESYEKIEKRHQFKLLRALLSILSHICDSKHGKKAVLQAGGVEALYRFATSCPASEKFGPILNSSVNVFLKCASKGDLPITSAKGPISFKIPLHKESSPTSNDEFSREATPDFDPDTTTDDELESELMDEDDQPQDLLGIDLTCEFNPQTTRLDDLLRMNVFFPESNHLRFPSSGSDPLDLVLEKDGDDVNNEAPSLYSELFTNHSASTRSLTKFVKIAYPDLVGANGPPYAEPLNVKEFKVCREKALETAHRVLNADNYQENVVYDLDFLISSEQKLITPSIPKSNSLSNYDEKRVGKKDMSSNHLNFESRFESGNLRRAIQVAPNEYNLLLNPDVNSSHYHQWFYFEVSNMKSCDSYIFNIINNEKAGSEFNSGMKPVMFSVKDALLGCPYWTRTGFDICYHKNHYVRSTSSGTGARGKPASKNCNGKCYYTATFTVRFSHSRDVCYLAYHYPYTYTRLQTFLYTLKSECNDPGIFFAKQVLCHTLNDNKVPVLTITSTKCAQEKETIFLTGRVHPGESGASWMMEGSLQFLLSSSPKAQVLRERFVFKVVPMLNPEGVICGNQRCGLTDEDLNRKWRSPKSSLHPSIYFTKALVEYLTAIVGKKPLVFCDFHGHSNQKNIFMYGCSRQQSWWPGDRDLPEAKDFLTLPQLAQRYMDAFSLRDCHFHVDRSREATARVVVWRQFKVPMSFTMEASTCGCDQGPYNNCHLNPRSLLESGEGFCTALFHLIHPRGAFPQHPLFDRKEDKSTEKNEEISDLDLDSEADLDMDLFGSR